jgi:hypothetical protein
LATYIINLILILHGIFADLLQLPDPPRVLSNDLVVKVLTRQNANLAGDDIDFGNNPEKVIDSVIRKRLRLPPD